MSSLFIVATHRHRHRHRHRHKCYFLLLLYLFTFSSYSLVFLASIVNSTPLSPSSSSSPSPSISSSQSPQPSPLPSSSSRSRSPSLITPPKPTMINSGAAGQEKQEKQQELIKKKKKKRAYVTVITRDEEVNKSLVMLSTLLATTKTAKTNCGQEEESHESIDYLCLILPKEFRGDDDIETNDSIWKQFDLGVSHSNIQKIVWSGCQVRPITHPIYNPNYGRIDQKNTNIQNDKDTSDNNDDDSNDRPSTSVLWPSINYNCLWVWSLEQYYETTVYIQYDHIILSNVNHLFDVPHPIINEPINEGDYKGFDHYNSKGDDSCHYHQYPNQHQPFMAAAPHHIVPNYFDSGVMIVQPSLTLFQDMVHLIKMGDVGGGIIADEAEEEIEKDSTTQIQTVNDFLNEKIYQNWYSMPPKHRLEPVYNAPYDWTFHESVWLSHRKEIHIFHYTEYNKPEDVISNPAKHRVSKYAAPLIYLWSLIMYFVSSPLVSLEDETRYVLEKVFDITKDSKDVVAYIARMKRGGTRRRIEVKESDDSDKKCERRDEL